MYRFIHYIGNKLQQQKYWQIIVKEEISYAVHTLYVYIVAIHWTNKKKKRTRGGKAWKSQNAFSDGTLGTCNR